MNCNPRNWKCYLCVMKASFGCCMFRRMSYFEYMKCLLCFFTVFHFTASSLEKKPQIEKKWVRMYKTIVLQNNVNGKMRNTKTFTLINSFPYQPL